MTRRRLHQLLRGQGGFSATEMLTVLALIGILALFTMPALMDFFRAMRVRTAAQRLVSHMRLCRQVAVARRSNVTMILQGNALTSTYQAWVDVVTDQQRNNGGRGTDNTANTDDDEPWVVRPDRQLEADKVKLKDAYNDTTPGTANEEFTSSNSVMLSNLVTVRFYPNGQVMRLDVNSIPVATDTLVRVRLDGRVSATRYDRWFVNFNRSGKVDTTYIRNPTWGLE